MVGTSATSTSAHTRTSGQTRPRARASRARLARASSRPPAGARAAAAVSSIYKGNAALRRGGIGKVVREGARERFLLAPDAEGEDDGRRGGHGELVFLARRANGPRTTGDPERAYPEAARERAYGAGPGCNFSATRAPHLQQRFLI